MEFCVISPVGGLEQFATLSKRHLVLAHIKNSRYKEFYKERKLLGDFLILDNGAYETGEPNEQAILEGIEYYEPDVVVLPDTYLGDAWDSMNQGYTFSRKYIYLKEHFGFEWMFVPQARPSEEREWQRNLEWGMMKINPKWVGLSRNLVADKRGTIFFSPLARVTNCLRIIREYGVSIHALGMANGCLPELWALHYAGCSSIDSSAPVWRGFNGERLGNMWSDIPLHFEHDESCDYKYVVDWNLKEVFRYAHHEPAR